MYKNELEERIMTALTYYWKMNPQEELTFEWKDGTIIKAVITTFYETDNGLEMEEEGYEEYNACTVKFTSVISLPEILIASISFPSREDIVEGANSEISYHNIPLKVISSSNNIVFNL
ncbi:hypothetical protein JYG23_04625 [Sedimentibacter sp. zth1]|uniref:hypothetical protein n=1 Tax=Sedimentibacter sp. zth1 TaxID=2816908 RepID=UPI001A92CFBD|nr:hypothetical protein [Sedimentibacter sp. zth1]QSX06735.1 hypothetical protein JYG23_04625 [Sedimentibacter sp. zth1]